MGMTDAEWRTRIDLAACYRLIARNGWDDLIYTHVHPARPDARCVMHLHATAGIAVSMLRCGLLPVSQHAMRFYENIAYHDYEGVALDPAEAERLIADLGPHKAMILRNHGVLTCGATVAEAYVLMATLEKACVTQLAAMAAASDLIVPPREVLDLAVSQLVDDTAPEGELEWPALLRRLEREDPSCAT